MNATVKEWLEKAEKDYATARRELAAQEDPNYDAVCFHAQQCIEKFLKALLIQRNVLPGKTHDLAYLVQLLAPVCPEWSWPMEDLRFLTRAAVAFRYPGEAADREDAAQAFDLATRLREKLRSLLKG
ncbi:MAG: HEPN domain-containing protein [Thermodesulfobacteriota bacterium]